MGKLILKLFMRASCIVLTSFHLWLTCLWTKCVFLVMIIDENACYNSKTFHIQLFQLSLSDKSFKLKDKAERYYG